MSRFEVIDTETTWGDAVMSIRVVIADTETFEQVGQRYYILTPFKNHGGMYTYSLYVKGIKPDLENVRGKRHCARTAAFSCRPRGRDNGCV